MTNFEIESQDESIKRMTQRAIDQAFVQHIGLIMGNWFMDDAEQPERAMRGMSKAIATYREACALIEDRLV